MKKILVILGHPAKKSLCEFIAEEYIKKAKKENNEIKYLKIKDLNFDPILHEGYSGEQLMEEDLKKAQQDIVWADHLVIIYPTWWGTYPALLKGFIDRIFLPGFAYKFHKGKMFQEKLLKGKSAHIITTLNSPSIYYDFVYFASGTKSLKTALLDFCGINPIKVTKIDNVRLRKEIKSIDELNII